jgi:hypothetical protein
VVRNLSPPAKFVLIALISAFAVATAACTFLVSFKDPEDGGATVDASRDTGGSGEDVVTDGPRPPLEAGTDFCPGYTADPAARPCSINSGRPVTAYCACDRLKNYQGSKGDLVTCAANGDVADTTHCENGCALYPPAISSVCDQCQAKADGKYCATEFGGDAGKVLLECRGGHQFQTAIDCPGVTRCIGPGPDAGCGT